MKKGEHGKALTEMKAAELEATKAGNALRQDKENAAAKNFEASASLAKANLKQAESVEAQVNKLIEEIRSTE
jgi:hypothetical protein